jgi:death on curing protein
LLAHLSAMDVANIHNDLVSEFASSGDPISPHGVRSRHLLESAVARQSVGFGSRMKYDAAHASCATLGYGICMNHPFFNGNKRTALVAMLCHLDRNDWTFDESVAQSDLYDLMLKIAKHGFDEGGSEGDRVDNEVSEIARWIRRRTRRVERGERIVTFRELKGILEAFGFEFDNLHDNKIDLFRIRARSLWFGIKKERRRERVLRMAYPGGGQVVGKGLLRDIREKCELDEGHGCDSKTFYGTQRPTDYFISRYRKTLGKLSKV